jgi:hypothetical protein
MTAATVAMVLLSDYPSGMHVLTFRVRSTDVRPEIRQFRD